METPWDDYIRWISNKHKTTARNGPRKFALRPRHKNTLPNDLSEKRTLQQPNENTPPPTPLTSDSPINGMINGEGEEFAKITEASQSPADHNRFFEDTEVDWTLSTLQTIIDVDTPSTCQQISQEVDPERETHQEAKMSNNANQGQPIVLYDMDSGLHIQVFQEADTAPTTTPTLRTTDMPSQQTKRAPRFTVTEGQLHLNTSGETTQGMRQTR